MNESEKLVWAAVYARNWTGQAQDTPTAVELAYCAVMDLRRAERKVVDGWGENDINTLMYRQMIED